jgi:hypothetical protein
MYNISSSLYFMVYNKCLISVADVETNLWYNEHTTQTKSDQNWIATIYKKWVKIKI